MRGPDRRASVGTTPERAVRRFSPNPNTIGDVPSRGATDTGTEEWERRLIQSLRTGHYLWRTEQAYRGWAGRFVRWLEARAAAGPNRDRLSPEQGGSDLVAPPGDGLASPAPAIEAVKETDIKEFLSEMATMQRTSASSQKQALNAIVFLLREVYGKELGDFSDFTRAPHHPRIPVVLTREECRELFAALEGSTRLMAELMYGSGVRLMELLGLRIFQRHPELVEGSHTVGDKLRDGLFCAA